MKYGYGLFLFPKIKNLALVGAMTWWNMKWLNTALYCLPLLNMSWHVLSVNFKWQKPTKLSKRKIDWLALSSHEKCKRESIWSTWIKTYYILPISSVNTVYTNQLAKYNNDYGTCIIMAGTLPQSVFYTTVYLSKFLSLIKIFFVNTNKFQHK